MNHDVAPIVRRVCGEYATGHWSTREIARRLTPAHDEAAENVRTVRAELLARGVDEDPEG